MGRERQQQIPFGDDNKKSKKETMIAATVAATADVLLG
jgi:hypothetical protein